MSAFIVFVSVLMKIHLPQCFLTDVLHSYIKISVMPEGSFHMCFPAEYTNETQPCVLTNT